MSEDLKDLLRRAVEWYAPAESNAESVIGRTRRRERRRRIGAGALALVLFAGSAVILYGAFEGRHRLVDRPPQPANFSPTGPRTSMLIPGVTITYPSEWTLLDLWSTLGYNAACGDAGACERIASSTGDPILQLSNVDLGLSSDVCSKAKPSVPDRAVVLYVAYARGLRDAADSTWPIELGPGEDSACSIRGGENLAATWLAPDGTPYLAFAYVGPSASESDRTELLDAFASMRFQTARFAEEGFDHPAYVIASGVDLGRPWNMETTIANQADPAIHGPEIILNLHERDVGGSISDIRLQDLLTPGMSWAGLQDGTMVWGAVSPEVESVEASGWNGETAVGQVVPMPASMQVGYSAFVVSIPDPAGGSTITTYDTDGNELASQTFGIGPSSTEYTDPTFGWRLNYPSSLRLSPFGTTDGANATGVTISNVPIDLGASIDALRSFPSDGVALRIWHNEDGPVAPITEDDTALPLSISDLQPIEPYVGGSEPAPSFLGFEEDGVPYAAAVWFGPDATQEDRAALATAIASLRFPATSPITTIGDRLIVLGAAGDYEVGSVTRFDRSELPINDGSFAQYEGDFTFYLVHGPGGFYAVATDLLGNGSRCDLRVETAPLRFTCPSLGAVWDRFGNVVTAAASSPADGVTELMILPTPISWDGNVMLDPFGNWPQAAIDAWPS